MGSNRWGQYTQQRKLAGESDTGKHCAYMESGLRRKKNASRQIEETNSFHRIRCSQSKPYSTLLTFRNPSALLANQVGITPRFEHQTSHKTPLSLFHVVCARVFSPFLVCTAAFAFCLASTEKIGTVESERGERGDGLRVDEKGRWAVVRWWSLQICSLVWRFLPPRLDLSFVFSWFSCDLHAGLGL